MTKLIIRDFHLKRCHGGVSLTLATIREKYWITRGKQTVMNVIKKMYSVSSKNVVKIEYEQAIKKANETVANCLASDGVQWHFNSTTFSTTITEPNSTRSNPYKQP